MASMLAPNGTASLYANSSAALEQEDKSTGARIFEIGAVMMLPLVGNAPLIPRFASRVPWLLARPTAILRRIGALTLRPGPRGTQDLRAHTASAQSSRRHISCE